MAQSLLVVNWGTQTSCEDLYELVRVPDPQVLELGSGEVMGVSWGPAPG